MTPLIPKPRKPWKDDPGHIHDSPGLPPEAPEPQLPEDLQDHPGVDLPTISSIPTEHATEEEREPQGEPAPVPELSEVDVPRALAQEIRRAMKRYPEKRSASIPALWAVQRRYGYCSPEGIEQAAAVMGVTPGYLQSVASFYDLFHLEPQGEHQVLVCTNISCWLRGADDILTEFKEAASIRSTPMEGTTGGSGGEAEQPPDFVSVRGFECLGACDLAPMASIDERYYGPLAEGDAEQVVEALRSKGDVLPSKRLEDRGAAGGKRNPADERVTKHSLNKVKGAQG